VNGLGKTKKVMAGITSTALMMGLASCGVGNQEQGNDEDWNSGSQGGSSSMDIPPAPEDQNCEEWEWDLDDGVWECDDSRSGYYGHFFYAGMFYATKPLLYKSKAYTDYKKSSAFKGRSTSTGTNNSVNSNNTGKDSGTITNNGSDSSKVKGSSGFGSGSSSVGG
jgi:hypothetical protein